MIPSLGAEFDAWVAALPDPARRGLEETWRRLMADEAIQKRRNALWFSRGHLIGKARTLGYKGPQ